MKITVTFNSQGRMLEGSLFIPGPDEAHQKPALLFEGSITGATSQYTDRLARAISEEGFVCMILDHSFFGDDESSPQAWESPSKRVEDIKSALHFLQEQGIVDPDRIAGVGVSVGAEYIARAIQQTDVCRGFLMVEGPYDDAQNFIGDMDVPSVVIDSQNFESTVDQAVLWLRSLFGELGGAYQDSVIWNRMDE
ncbi:MAG: alpha/beta hydrolase [Bacillota bacterium]